MATAPDELHPQPFLDRDFSAGVLTDLHAQGLEQVTAGVLHLINPPPDVYRWVLQSHVLAMWQARLTAELDATATLVEAYRPCHALEQALQRAWEVADAALCTRIAQGRWMPSHLMDAVHHAAEKETLRAVLEALQRGVHAATFPWHVREAVTRELAPWQAELDAHEARLRGQLCDAFGFLAFSTFELFAVRAESGDHRIVVAYAPRSDAGLTVPTTWGQPSHCATLTHKHTSTQSNVPAGLTSVAHYNEVFRA